MLIRSIRAQKGVSRAELARLFISKGEALRDGQCVAYFGFHAQVQEDIRMLDRRDDKSGDREDLTTISGSDTL